MAKRRIRDHEKVPTRSLIEMSMSGSVDPRSSASADEVSSLLGRVNTVLSDLHFTSKRIAQSYVVTFYNPTDRTFYHTICRNGVIAYTGDETGNVSTESVIGNKDELLKLIAQEGVPSQTRVKRTGKSSPGGAQRKGTPPKHRFDPALAQFIKDKAIYLSNLVTTDHDATGRRDICMEMIERSNPDLVSKVHQEGIEVKGESIEDFVLKNKRGIRKIRMVYQNDLLNQTDVQDLDIEFRRHAAQGSTLVDYLSDESKAREVLEWFEEHNDTEHTTPNLLSALREGWLNDWPECNSPERTAILKPTREWINTAQSVHYLREDQGLQDLWSESVSGHEDKDVSERNYQAVVQLAKRVVLDRTHSMPELKFMIRGLWAAGQLKKTHVAKGTSRFRSPKAAAVLYVQPISFLEGDRYESIDSTLRGAFQRALDEDAFTPKVRATKSSRYAGIGQTIYAHVPIDVRNDVFKSKKTGVALKETSSHLIGALKMYVALNSDWINQRLDEKYGEKSAE